jgi:hypothetical protein
VGIESSRTLYFQRMENAFVAKDPQFAEAIDDEAAIFG